MAILRRFIYCRIMIGTLYRTAAFLGAITIACITLMTLPSRSLAQEPPTLTQTLDIEAEGTNITIRYPEGWSTAQDGNVHKLLNVPVEEQGTLDVSVIDKTAQIMIFTESRKDHAEAVRRLKEIEAETDSPSTFLTIGEWPALQRRHLAPKPQPGQGSLVGEPGEMVLEITTAIAADSLLVRLEGSLRPDAPPAVAKEIEAIGKSLVFPTSGNPDQVEQEIQDLRMEPRLGSSLFTPVPETLGSSEDVEAFGESAGASVRVRPTCQMGTCSNNPAVMCTMDAQCVGTDSELEIAVSTNGQNIVIGSNANYHFSTNGGRTFNPSTGIVGNDPSLAFGPFVGPGVPNGTFYAANIRLPSMTPPTPGSTAISFSTDNGQNFAFRANAFVCQTTGPNTCSFPFPDQEHIAADRFNTAPGGDQVYSVFRRGGNTWGIVCSADSGNTWSTNAFFTPGDFPRITVGQSVTLGQDGFVYVVYRQGRNIMLRRFNSCRTNQNPMVPAAPVLVAAGVTDVACPVPGLDRCNNGNLLSSHTVAVDDTNANHIYVAYAVNTRPGDGTNCTVQNNCNDDVIIRDSTDGGSTWPDERAVSLHLNNPVVARRFMPWVCALGGVAHVSWYERRTFSGVNNDLTDYFRGNARLIAGTLIPGFDFQVNEAGSTDAQCAAGQAPGSPASWPFGVRATGDSESCSVQPQLAGFCCLPCPQGTMDPCVANADPCGAGSSLTPCDFDQGPACTNAGETCSNRGGVPKYGDYNGNACAAGRLYMAWASATSPPSITPASTDIDIFFAQEPPLRADLSINKIDSPDPVRAEADALTYTVIVTNTGPDTATEVTVTDTLPPGVTFIDAQNCSESGGTVTCKRGDGVLANGASDVFKIIVQPTTAAIGTITNRASVKANESDPNTDNNTAAQNTTVNPPPPADLSITVTDSPDPVTVGDNLTYSLTFINNGPGTAFGVTIEGRLGAGVTFVSAPGFCTESGGIVTCNFINLGSGTTGLINVVVTPTAAGTIANVFRVLSRVPDPDETNNTAGEITTVRPAPEIVNNLVKFESIESTFKTTSDKFGCPSEFAGKFSFTTRLTNTSNKSLSDLLVEVTTLTNGNLVQTNRGPAGGVGTRLDVAKVGGFSDGVLSPGEFVDVPFVICLRNKDPFDFFVDVLGVVQ